MSYSSSASLPLIPCALHQFCQSRQPDPLPLYLAEIWVSCHGNMLMLWHQSSKPLYWWWYLKCFLWVKNRTFCPISVPLQQSLDLQDNGQTATFSSTEQTIKVNWGRHDMSLQTKQIPIQCLKCPISGCWLAAIFLMRLPTFLLWVFYSCLKVVYFPVKLSQHPAAFSFSSINLLKVWLTLLPSLI